jgi:hypothetical protein
MNVDKFHDYRKVKSLHDFFAWKILLCVPWRCIKVSGNVLCCCCGPFDATGQETKKKKHWSVIFGRKIRQIFGRICKSVIMTAVPRQMRRSDSSTQRVPRHKLSAAAQVRCSRGEDSAPRATKHSRHARDWPLSATVHYSTRAHCTTPGEGCAHSPWIGPPCRYVLGLRGVRCWGHGARARGRCR